MPEERTGGLPTLPVQRPEASSAGDGATGAPSADPVIRRAQFERIAMPLADSLFATALRMTRHAARAEDLVQEAYIRAWQNFDRFTLGTNFKAWIFRILTLLYRNERRSAKTREQTVDPATADQILPAADGGDGSYEAKKVDWDELYPDLVDDEFKRALDRLDEDQRVVLMLVTLGELSYQETVEALEIPIGTVMSRLFRARKQLQQELAAYAQERGLLRSEGAK
ncbi:MAG: RNA polymerase sigma factor RpoE [Planctomycetota bacterium]